MSNMTTQTQTQPETIIFRNMQPMKKHVDSVLAKKNDERCLSRNIENINLVIKLLNKFSWKGRMGNNGTRRELKMFFQSPRHTQKDIQLCTRYFFWFHSFKSKHCFSFS